MANAPGPSSITISDAAFATIVHTVSPLAPDDQLSALSQRVTQAILHQQNRLSNPADRDHEAVQRWARQLPRIVQKHIQRYVPSFDPLAFYRAWLQAIGANPAEITADDIAPLIWLAAKTTSTASPSPSDHPDIIMVDEAQNIAPTQWAALAQRYPNARWILTGDLRQHNPDRPGITTWDVIAAAGLPRPDRLPPLTMNYRTTPPIVDVLNRWPTPSDPDAHHAPMQAVPMPNAIPVRYLAAPTPAQYRQWVVQWVRTQFATTLRTLVVVPRFTDIAAWRALLAPMVPVWAETDGGSWPAKTVGIATPEAVGGLECAHGLLVDADVSHYPPDASGLARLYIAASRAQESLAAAWTAPASTALPALRLTTTLQFTSMRTLPSHTESLQTLNTAQDKAYRTWILDWCAAHAPQGHSRHVFVVPNATASTLWRPRFQAANLAAQSTWMPGQPWPSQTWVIATLRQLPDLMADVVCLVDWQYESFLAQMARTQDPATYYRGQHLTLIATSASSRPLHIPLVAPADAAHRYHAVTQGDGSSRRPYTVHIHHAHPS